MWLKPKQIKLKLNSGHIGLNPVKSNDKLNHVMTRWPWNKYRIRL
jgi:hypothetical protein